MRTLWIVVLVCFQLTVFAQDSIINSGQPMEVALTNNTFSAASQQMNFAPALRLNLYTSYAFDDKVDSYYSESDQFYGKIKGGFLWGAGLEYMLRPTQSIELSYQRLDSNSPMTYYLDGELRFSNFDMASNYIMLGGNRYFGNMGMVEPYGGAMIGMAIVKVTDEEAGNADSNVKFAWGVKLGANIWVSETVGLKIQAGLISAVQSVGGGLYFGSGGISPGLNTYSSMMQFNLGGGMVFKF